ncbi:MAG: energy-coupling factor ABC transporter permease [Deltaproteobacteria bacterium]|nr:energy-coupling factor ABC transporter permease [Deltaproteobacteria bacterium]
MHMADALVSPTVGGALWAVSGSLMAYCARRLGGPGQERKVPTMGVLGAFVFAAQMINFAIPGTGSSGHLGGGMLLAILLGPHAAFLTMASLLTVQALLFADGGLLALGCNVFNLAFFTSFLAYPLVYRRIVRDRPTPGRILAGSLASAVFALQLGSAGVVLETAASGVTALPAGAFLLLMQPIHLAIGVVEGLVTAAVVNFVWRAAPELLLEDRGAGAAAPRRGRRVLAVLTVGAALTVGGLSWFASTRPDGLEWAVGKVLGGSAPAAIRTPFHTLFARLQERTALMPDYALPTRGAPAEQRAAKPAASAQTEVETSLAGFVGGLLTLALAAGVGFALRLRRG